jgi:hypothetical protein
LGRDKAIDPSPLVRGTPLEGWEEVLTFAFASVELKNCTLEEIRRFKSPALLTLLSLVQGGDRWEVVQGMLHDLEALGEHELLKIAFDIAYRKGPEENRPKLKKEYRMIYEELRKDPLFAEFLKDEHEEGVEEGRQEGRQEGLQEALRQATWLMRQTAVGVVARRFPALQQRAQKKHRQGQGSSALGAIDTRSECPGSAGDRANLGHSGG